MYILIQIFQFQHIKTLVSTVLLVWNLTLLVVPTFTRAYWKIKIRKDSREIWKLNFLSGNFIPSISPRLFCAAVLWIPDSHIEPAPWVLDYQNGIIFRTLPVWMYNEFCFWNTICSPSRSIWTLNQQNEQNEASSILQPIAINNDSLCVFNLVSLDQILTCEVWQRYQCFYFLAFFIFWIVYFSLLMNGNWNEKFNLS